jgi:hypothetical protein
MYSKFERKRNDHSHVWFNLVIWFQRIFLNENPNYK